MYRIGIILMLSTIIPSLDCCSSRTLFQKEPIKFYRAVELSMQKSTQFQKNDPLEGQPPPPALPTTTGDDQTTISYNRHHHLHYEEESDKEEENLKLNRSQRSDLLNEETELEQHFEEKYTPASVDDDDDTDHDDDDDDDDKDDGDQDVVNIEQSIGIASSEQPMDDAQYIFISQIVSIECLESFRLEFCLNGGRCFLYPILNESLLSCACADGFVGERCEGKSYEYIPRIRPRFALAKTIGGPFVCALAVIDILFLLFLFCKNCYRD